VSKFDLNDERTDHVIQRRLDWICIDCLKSDLPAWVKIACVRTFEEDCGLPNRFINIESFPTLSTDQPKISVHDLRKQLSAGDNHE